MNTIETKLECFVSVVALVKNQWSIIESYVPTLQAYLERHFADYEIVLVDQRSEDETLVKIGGLLESVPCVRFIELSFRVDDEVALSAGLENSIGDFTVLFELGSDPIDVILKMIELSVEGPDIVIGTHPGKPSLGYRLLRPAADLILKEIGYTLPRGASSPVVVSRRAANAVMSVGRFHHKFLVRLCKTGYPCEAFNIQHCEGKRKPKALGIGLQSLFRMIVYNSTVPLRWMSMAGLLGNAFAFLFALYSFLTKLFIENVAAGWASSVMFDAFMFMLLFTMLAFFGEYLARLLDDQGGYKDYAVVSERHSSVLINKNRLNVIEKSL